MIPGLPMSSQLKGLFKWQSKPQVVKVKIQRQSELKVVKVKHKRLSEQQIHQGKLTALRRADLSCLPQRQRLRIDESRKRCAGVHGGS